MNYRGLWIFLILSLPALANAQTAAQTPLSELALFNRCYSHITQRSLPLSHPLRAQVKAGSLKAVDACMQVLDGAKLNSQTNEGTLINNSTEAQQVLTTFNDFHRTWFPNDNMMKAIQFLEDFNYQPYIHDESEAGLHVTRALFTDGLKFSEIVTGSSGMEALRSNGPSQYDKNATPDKKLQQWSSSDSSQAQRVAWNPAELVQTGNLMGVRRMTLNSNKINLITNSTDGTQVGDKYYYSPGPVYPNVSQGGGIIGSASYLLLNLGRPNVNASDGGLVMNRRWAKAVYNDILCRDLPTVRIADAIPLVQTAITSATPPFRKAGTCMSCHSSMDGMAKVARNLTFATNSYVLYGGTVHIRKWDTNQPPETDPVDLDVSFFQRPTVGKLFYRSYNGNLVNQQVNSIADLGSALSQTDDLYVCAAARYFKFFTGVKVNLQDAGDPNLPALSASDKAYRDFVINLGLALKNSQSLRTLIQSIISSDVYRSSAMRL